MSTSSRFKLVSNSTGAALTTAGIAVGDGNDRSTRTIKRTLSASDIGNTAGKTQHELGCIIDVLQSGPNISGTVQPGINILNLSGASWRKMDASGARPISYKRLDGTTDDGTNVASLQYFFYPTDNTIRVFDGGADAAVQLADNDYVEVELTFGNS